MMFFCCCKESEEAGLHAMVRQTLVRVSHQPREQWPRVTCCGHCDKVLQRVDYGERT